MRLSGVPANFSAKCADQPTVKPQFAGRSGEISTSGSSAVHPPVLPRRGQEAPPSASTTASASWVAPSAKRRRPWASHPVHSARVTNFTPRLSSRLIQARSSGLAFITLGKTRPLLPTKVDCPSPAHHSRTASGGNSASQGVSQSAAAP